MRNQGEAIDVSLPNGLHPYGVSLWDETFTRVAPHTLANALLHQYKDGPTIAPDAEA